MATSPEDAPLARGSLAGSEEALILPNPPMRNSNSRAFKIAGLTTLACLLLASQVFTAYLMFNQKQQIHTLERSSERMSKMLTRQSNAPVRRQMPMASLPLLMDTLAVDPENTKGPSPKPKEPVVSVEKQLKDLMQEAHLPQFNETFLANLKSLQQQMNESEWTSFQAWMRFWLIFQMAQQQPPPPTPEPATVIQTKCQAESSRMIGSYQPQCDEQGRYKPMQCWHATGFCWCVDETGATIEGTAIRGRPDCSPRRTPYRMMVAPRLMQKTISLKDD